MEQKINVPIGLLQEQMFQLNKRENILTLYITGIVTISLYPSLTKIIKTRVHIE